MLIAFRSIVIIVCLILIYFMSLNLFKGYRVKEGQLWVKEYNKENTFEQIERDTLLILSVKGKYCKYKRFGRIYSDKRYWIPVNARLISE